MIIVKYCAEVLDNVHLWKASQLNIGFRLEYISHYYHKDIGV